MNAQNNLPKPFLKWAGGKTKLLPHIIAPIKKSKYTYFEPFLGGGAVFFGLYRKGYIKNAFLNDLNPEVYNCYTVIKHQVNDLIEKLKETKYENTKDKFQAVRSTDVTSLSDVERAARLIYLNKTCFNGLYRVNKSGLFNVPYGKYSNPLVCDRPNLIAVSEALQIAQLSCISYSSAMKNVRKGNLVYMDPPYAPISKTSNFTGYTSNGFSMMDHENLAIEFKRLKIKGAHCILSNSSSEKVLELFQGENLEYINGARNIGGSPDSRKHITEIIVR